MKETLELIEKHIPEPHTIELNKNGNLCYYDILNKKEENIGYIKLTSSGDLKTYAYTGKAFKHIKHPITEKSILEKANVFLKTFVKNSRLTQASIFTYSNNYQINYEEKDVKLNLYIPDSGAEIIINLAGNILSFDKKDDKYKVIYPDRIITSEEAKSHYLNRLNLDLKVSKPTNHNHYKLVYRINEEIDYVSASGKEIDSKLIKQQLISLDSFSTSSDNLFRILGLDGQYAKISKKNIKDRRIELWSKRPKKSLIHLNYDINEPQLDVIKYKINKHTNQIIQICDGETFLDDLTEKLTSKKAFDRALDFLFTVYPKANELFDIIDSVIDGEDEIDQKYEPNFMFYFNRVHDSIEIENQIAYIGVGKYTGMINKFCAPTVTEKELAHINVFAKVTETEAKVFYAKDLKMNLCFVKKMVEQANTTYELAYLPTFPNGKTKVYLIDAHQGEIYEAEEKPNY